MERGQLGLENRACTIFIFEGLIGIRVKPRSERLARRMGQWKYALSLWQLDYRVTNAMAHLASRDVPIEVYTWREPEFAEALHDRLWDLQVPVRDTIAAPPYPVLSQILATDDRVSMVYDAEPSHRHGYGFKGRAFSLQNL